MVTSSSRSSEVRRRPSACSTSASVKVRSADRNTSRTVTLRLPSGNPCRDIRRSPPLTPVRGAAPRSASSPVTLAAVRRRRAAAPGRARPPDRPAAVRRRIAPAPATATLISPPNSGAAHGGASAPELPHCQRRGRRPIARSIRSLQLGPRAGMRQIDQALEQPERVPPVPDRRLPARRSSAPARGRRSRQRPRAAPRSAAAAGIHGKRGPNSNSRTSAVCIAQLASTCANQRRQQRVAEEAVIGRERIEHARRAAAPPWRPSAA